MPISVLTSYKHLGSFKSVSPLGNGHINDTYLVENEKGGKYVLQRINSNVFTKPIQLIDNQLRIEKQLEHNYYPYVLPKLLPNDEGVFLTIQETNQGTAYWRLLTFCEAQVKHKQIGQPKNRQLPSPTLAAYRAAFAFGLFDACLKDVPVETLCEPILGFHDTPLRWKAMEKAMETDPKGRMAHVETEIKALYRWKPAFEAVFALINSGALPRQVLHNDAKTDNILVDTQSGEVVAVLDWDTVMPGCILADYGDLVRSFAPNHGEDFIDFARLRLRKNYCKSLKTGFLDGYFYKKTEKPSDRTQLSTYLDLAPAWIIGEQALRFLTDYLLGDIYYKINYAEHNLMRARNQLRVLDLL